MPRDPLQFRAVRGMDDVRIAEVELGGAPFKVGVAHGGAAVLDLVRRVKEGVDPDVRDLRFVEIMMCKGGCVGGAGNPKPPPGVDLDATIRKRIAALHADASSGKKGGR